MQTDFTWATELEVSRVAGELAAMRPLTVAAFLEFDEIKTKVTSKTHLPALQLGESRGLPMAGCHGETDPT